MRINEPLVFETALRAVASGGLPVKSLNTGRGRPTSSVQVGDTVLNGIEFDLYKKLYEFGCQCRKMTDTEIFTDEEFVVFMKEAAPRINKRMIEMAMVSDDLKAIRQVAGDLADRGYGKASQQININVSNTDIRAAWKQLEQRDVKLIDAKVINDSDEVIEDEVEVIND